MAWRCYLYTILWFPHKIYLTVILLVWLPTHYNGHLSYKNFYLNANTVTLDIFKLINWGILHMKQYR